METLAIKGPVVLICAASWLCGCQGPPTAVNQRLIDEPPVRRTISALLAREPLWATCEDAEPWRPVTSPDAWRTGADGTLHAQPTNTRLELEAPSGWNREPVDLLQATVGFAGHLTPMLIWEGASCDHAVRARPELEVTGDGERAFSFLLAADPPPDACAPIKPRLRFDLAVPRALTLSCLRAFELGDVTAEALATGGRIEIDHDLREGWLLPPGARVERALATPSGGILTAALGASGPLSIPVTVKLSVLDADDRQIASLERPLKPIGEHPWQALELELPPGRGSMRAVFESLGDEGAYRPVRGVPVIAEPWLRTGRRALNAPSIVLISIDTLRADRVGTGTMPRLDAWARDRAASFEQVIATAPWTLPSHASMLTGLEALRHGVNQPFAPTPSTLTTLAERLRAAGFATAALTGGGWLHPAYGLDQGFERFRYWPSSGDGDAELQAHAPIARRWLQELPRPFFLFFHTYAVHDYLPPGTAKSPGDRAVLYDRAVRRSDELLGPLLDELAALRGDLAALRGDVLVIVTSDHGEALGEQDDFGHGSLRDPVLRVPLLIEWPDGLGAGRRFERQVRGVDLVPTILEAAGLVDVDGDGRSLGAWLRGGEAPPVTAASYFVHRGLSLRLDGQLKYLLDPAAWPPAPRERLFDLATDPAETTALAVAGPEAAALRDHAQVLLERWLPGWSSSWRNRSSSTIALTLSGPATGGAVWSAAASPTGVTRLADGRVELELAGGEEIELRFAPSADGRLEITVEPSMPGSRLVLELGEVEERRGFRWSAEGWSQGTGEAVGQDLELIVTRRGVADGDAAPYQLDSALRSQLKALGYL